MFTLITKEQPTCTLESSNVTGGGGGDDSPATCFDADSSKRHERSKYRTRNFTDLDTLLQVSFQLLCARICHSIISCHCDNLRERFYHQFHLSLCIDGRSSCRIFFEKSLQKQKPHLFR